MSGRWWVFFLFFVPATSSAQTVSASLRGRVESWDWFGADGGSYVYAGALARVGLSDQRSKFGWRVEAAAPLLLGLPDDAVVPAPGGQLGAGGSYWQGSDSAQNVASIFLKQAFIRFGNAPGQGGHSLRIGRFEFMDGVELPTKNATVTAVKRDRVAQRMLGNFGWTHVQRSLDGVHYAYDRPRFNATVLATRPTQGVFDVAGMEDLAIGITYASINGSLSGDAADWRLFAIHYRDYRDDPRPLKTDNRAAAVRALDREDVQLATLGGHYVRSLTTSAGLFDVLLWGALQTGDWGLLDHSAHAFSVEAGIQPRVLAKVKPWLRAGYLRSSGDDDASDGTHRTFFQVAPTPRVYARFPFYNMMNLEDKFVSLVLRPSPRWTVRADAHMLDLSERADLWYVGGGAFEAETFGFAGRPSNGANELAKMLDLSADFRINDHVSINGYAAIAKAGDVIDRIFPGNGSLAYIEIELRK